MPSSDPGDRPDRPDPRDARSLLFVPGNRGDRFTKAAASGADAVVCDLEDGVAPAAKDTARDTVAGWLRAGGRAVVRINAPGTPWYDRDIAALAGLPGLLGVMLPKAESTTDLATLCGTLGTVLPLVETALGVHRAHEIAAVPGVVRLVFGSLDYALDAGTALTDTALLHARSTLVLASRVGGIIAPVDGVTTDLADPAATASAARLARDLGFGGKLCIHPRQVDPVNHAFSPSTEEIRRATQIVKAVTDDGVAVVDGAMVDRPVVEAARRTLIHAARRQVSLERRDRHQNGLS
ncbi:CoA ester lyase [Polymorphospora sp. NPDC051019]|uniref:HpcH/HpaI aldolase/citrate lyase family protein n=1 Tax=Polymorphospora sp. NPDC051019 TaxID=3155725 RepID=UPI0034146700